VTLHFVDEAAFESALKPHFSSAEVIGHDEDGVLRVKVTMPGAFHSADFNVVVSEPITFPAPTANWGTFAAAIIPIPELQRAEAKYIRWQRYMRQYRNRGSKR